MYQCRLKQGEVEVIAWISDRGAVQDAEVEIPELEGFWRVTHVYSRMDDKDFRKMQIRHHKPFKSIE